jgi:hypothetical protein
MIYRKLLVIDVALLLLSCSDNLNEEDKAKNDVMNEIESKVIMPQGSDRLGIYNRYYGGASMHSVLGVFVRKSNDYRNFNKSDCKWKYDIYVCRIYRNMNEDVKKSDRAFVDDERFVPQINGGKCNIVSFRYDFYKKVFTNFPSCNDDI